ncbi:unnamed protein product [Rhizoctonia solani]|uniref:Rnh202 triple barrel domain-containing protein n=1 Tax=Rhizoctonia solani TaxID=456999 RepID=A0A8H2X6Y8_9AGAM|nr:unnamed protein product [Rhizoctonia solani]
MSTHITVLPEDFQKAVKQSGSSLRPLQLPHPRTGLRALFVYHGSTLLELHSVTPDTPRSWFVGESVVSNGNLMLMTPIDPVFILIPFLQGLDPKAPFKPTDDFLEEALLSYSPPDINKQDVALFMTLGCARRALKQLCETKVIPPDISVHKPSPERITAFIKRRLERVISAQAVPEPSTSEPASDSTLQPSSGSTPGKVQSFPTIQRQHLRLGLSVEELGPLDCPKAQAIRAATRIKIAGEIVGNWVEESLMAEILATYDISAYTNHATARAEHGLNLRPQLPEQRRLKLVKGGNQKQETSEKLEPRLPVG